MSWNDYYRRREAMEAVLKQARRDPSAPLPIDEVAGARETFGSEENLLLALHYRWTQVLGGRLRSGGGGPEDAADVPDAEESDHVDAVGAAWRATARANPVLRAVLDAHAYDSPAVRRAHEAELRMLAITAGLAEHGDELDEVTRIGGAFVALLKESTVRRTAPRRTNPVGEWLRKLAPAG